VAAVATPLPLSDTAPRTPSWGAVTRVAFRFVFIYFSLWSVVNQVLGGLLITPWGSFPALGRYSPLSDVTTFVGSLFFGLDVVFEAGNSGDTAFYWVQTSWLFTLSLLATALWSGMDKRTEYDTLHKWFRLFIRFGLAAQMFFFGMAKVVPTQFVPPALTTLVTPIGHFPLSNLLWVFVGASTPYQVFTGVAEMAAGVFLVFPKTTPLGALIALTDMLQVFALNTFYDFGLKQISVHYILMALILIAPDLRRIGNVLVFDRPAPASSQPPLFGSERANRIAVVAQAVFAVYLVAIFTSVQLRQYTAADGPAHPRSALYGIWDIERLSIDGIVQPPVLNAYDFRWRRAIFDFPDRMAFQRTDDSLARYDSSIDTDQRTVVLRKGQTGLSAFSFERPSEDRLILDGSMGSHAIRMELALVGRDTWRLLNSPFRWIRPPD
jgi:hypothetical protein